jgi:hypothetical protein
MSAPSLVESRWPEAEAIINASDEDGTVSGGTERMSTPELKETVAGTVSRNQSFLGLYLVRHD